jgi:hypothetical protein
MFTTCVPTINALKDWNFGGARGNKEVPGTEAFKKVSPPAQTEGKRHTAAGIPCVGMLFNAWRTVSNREQENTCGDM